MGDLPTIVLVRNDTIYVIPRTLEAKSDAVLLERLALHPQVATQGERNFGEITRIRRVVNCMSITKMKEREWINIYTKKRAETPVRGGGRGPRSREPRGPRTKGTI